MIIMIDVKSYAGHAISGALAVAGLLVGKFAVGYIPSFPYQAWVLALIGVGIAGMGIQREGKEGAFIAGFGVSLALPLAGTLVGGNA